MIADNTAMPGARSFTLLIVAALAVMALAPFWPDASTASAASTAPCNPARPHASGSFDHVIDSGGLTREYVLHIPASYDGTTAVPLVFNLHAFASNPTLQDLWSEMPAKGEEEGFIVVSPLGTIGEVGFFHWNSSEQPDPEPDDVAFLGELLTYLEAQLCIDDTHVYSTGLSNGASMSSQLACSIPDRIAAIGPVAGVAYYDDCSPVPVPVITFHGTADPISAFAPKEDTVVPAWAAHNGCGASAEQDPLPGTTGVRLVRYAGCDDDATVELYAVFDADTVTPGKQGGGHTWPGSGFVINEQLEALVGISTLEISANDLMWDFFLANPLPKPASVGGVSTGAELRALPLESTEPFGYGPGALAGIASAIAAGMFVLGGAAWYASRRLTA